MIQAIKKVQGKSTAHYQPVQRLLEQLSDALRASSLWSEQQPTSVALASEMPFCCDTLSFENWLQFVFLPKLSQVIEYNLPLPKALVIAPMAEQSWRAVNSSDAAAFKRIYKVLREIDNYFAELIR